MAVAPRLLGYSTTRLLGGRLEEEGGEVVGGGATKIGGDGLGRKEGLYVSGIVAEADHLGGKLLGGGVEKEIAGEWHVLNLQAKSFERLGVAALLRDLSTEVQFHEGSEGIHGDLDKEKA